MGLLTTGTKRVLAPRCNYTLTPCFGVKVSYRQTRIVQKLLGDYPLSSSPPPPTPKKPCPRGEIGSRLKRLRPDRREFDGFEFVALDKRNSLPSSWIERLNHEACMNYYLLEEYLACTI